MSGEPKSNYSGILSSLKKLIFEDSPETTSPTTIDPSTTNKETKAVEDVTKKPQTDLMQNSASITVTDVKQMKVKVLEMLEKMNEPNLDFFEVWNAAAEMGNVDTNSIKAAFTSLKYVDKSLDKEKLLRSGKHYADELKKVIDKETEQKKTQKQNVEQNLIAEKANLSNEVKSIEQNIADLQEKLLNKQKDLKEINSKYEPEIKDIDNKIAIGNAAVNEVIADIQKTLNIIETNIN